MTLTQTRGELLSPPGRAFDEDYFENGLITGKSAYTNYSWLPELTLPLCHEILWQLAIAPEETILDFGCAKGFMVKAFRLLHREAWGVDISAYAIAQAPLDVRPYVSRIDSPDDIPTGSGRRFSWGIAKDVLEHIPPPDLDKTLSRLRACCDRLFVVVPLGDGRTFVAPENNLDTTHVVCQDLDWWSQRHATSGWHVDLASFSMPHIKKRYEKVTGSTGFFVLS